MFIRPVAFESLGTRSMCTYVETGDVKILIDPGVSLAPYRFGFPPHPVELKCRADSWNDILGLAERSDVMVVTHYHYDHFNPFDGIRIYAGKTVLVKHPKENINYSQIKRSGMFLCEIKGLAETLDYADGKSYSYGRTSINFSKAVFHGANSTLGYVLEVMVDDGFRLVYSSDVEGPGLPDQVEFIINSDPDMLILDGPMTYMLGYRYSYESFNRSVENILKIIDSCSLRNLVIDHHTLRDLEWQKKFSRIFDAASGKGVRVQSAAEYLGRTSNLLEARRKELYDKQPI